MRKVVDDMNIYNNDAIFLSEESTRDFINTLMFDKDSLSRRDSFVSELVNNISFEDDGNEIIVDIPDIELTDEEIVKAEKRITTKNIDITIAKVMATNVYQCSGYVQAYNITVGKNMAKYNMCSKDVNKDWNTNIQTIDVAA